MFARDKSSGSHVVELWSGQLARVESLGLNHVTRARPPSASTNAEIPYAFTFIFKIGIDNRYTNTDVVW